MLNWTFLYKYWFAQTSIYIRTYMFRCVVNCKAKKNNQEKFSVEGKCTNYGAGARLLYKWELFERSSAAEKWRPIPDERFKTTTGRSSKNLVVSPEVITPGTFCMLKYSSWIAGNIERRKRLYIKHGIRVFRNWLFQQITELNIEYGNVH